MAVVKIKKIMNKKIPSIYETDSISDAIKLLIKMPESALPVLNKRGKVVGELNQRDLLLVDVGKEEASEDGGLGFRKLKFLLKSKAKTVKDLMNKQQLNLKEDDDVLKAAKLLYDEEISTLPIVNNKGKLVGMVSDITILKHYKTILGTGKKKKMARKSVKKVVKKKTKKKRK